MLYFRQILILLVSLYTSRVLLQVLGVSDYGVYNVVGGVVTLFGFFNGAMVSATQRFMAYDLGRGDFDRLRVTFNATQLIHIGVALFIFILAETIGLWFVKSYLVIPPERMSAALWVYHFVVLSFMVTIIQVPYNSLVIAEERMSVYALISILDALLKLSIVIVLPYIVTFDPLVVYGGLLFSVAVFVALIYRLYVRRNFPSSRFYLVKDKDYYKILLSYSGWNIFGNLAGVVKGQGINILINVFFGPTVNAAQAVAHQVSSALNTFYYNFQLASKPQIIKNYAKNDIAEQLELVYRTAKISYILLLVMTVPVILEIEYILDIWLVTPPKFASTFVVLVLLNSLIECVSEPLMTAIQATGRVKVYQIFIGSLLILNLPITFLLFKLGQSPETTYFVSIAISLIALIGRLTLTKKYISDFSVNRFFNGVVIRGVIVSFLSSILPFLFHIYLPVGFSRLLLVTLASIVSSISVFYVLGLSHEEQNQFKKIMTNKLVRWKK